MKLFRLETVQNLPISIASAWDFFSDPKNLKEITPPYMGFDILSGGNETMYPGQIIQYKVTPIAKIPMRWVTEITHVEEGKYFVDEQRFGPYALWHHKHFFSPIKNGVQMRDCIDYKLPLGWLGQWFQPLVVRPRLEEIFNYRKQVLTERFGAYEHA